jgi:hypothetical protein
MKIRPVGVDMFHADGRTDRNTDRIDEANSPFSQFCERAKNENIYRVTILIYCSWFIGFVYLNLELHALSLV